MVDQGMVSPEVLQEALDLQVQYQGTIHDLLARESAPAGQAGLPEAAVA
jgi:hypothetical protein